MAHPFYFSCYTKVLVFSLLLFLFLSLCSTSYSKPQLESTSRSTRVSSRRILEVEKEEQDEKPLKKKTTTTQTKLIKSNTTTPSKNQTKTTKPSNLSSKNQTKTIESNNTISIKNQTKSNATPTKTIKSNNLYFKDQTKQLKVSTKESPKTTPTDTAVKKKLNSTTTPKSKKLNSTSKATTPVSTSSKKPLDLVKASNKTTKATATDKQTKSKTSQSHDTKQQSKKPAKQAPPGWFIDDEDDDDLVSISEFRDLPNKFQRTLIPDLERITTTSKAYLTKANDEITKGFKPYVGNKYAPTVAAVASCAFILIPLLLVSLLCTRIKAFFSLQKILIFIQVYLSIYFTILCVS
ncbi:cell wall protein DAN4-like [Lotus japonicus]|uniref:cell wall protein DAN4-like n=1 Tax=Lotus japonicus TaxID=34305 RepID=UPI002582FA95|nr:cell wall protein DAN4-like [Lotus japonicus]